MARKKEENKSEGVSLSSKPSVDDVLKKEIEELKSALASSKEKNKEIKLKVEKFEKDLGELDSLRESTKRLTLIYNNAKTRLSKLEDIKTYSEGLEAKIESLEKTAAHGGSETPKASSFNGVVEAYGDHIHRFGSDKIGRA